MTYIQNDHYLRAQAWHLDRVVQINKYHSRTGDLVTSHCLRVRIRNHHSGSDSSFAVVEEHVGRYKSVTGWVEVLSRDIQFLRCKIVSYADKEGGYELFNQDANDLISLAFKILKEGK